MTALPTYLRNKYTFSKKLLPEVGALVHQQLGLCVEYGIAFYNNNHFQRTFLPELYARVSYKTVQLQVGRY